MLEGLEKRIVLYSTLGAWTYDSRITYSFMPDGTNISGTPSSLFATLNAKFATTTWEQQIETAASLWENVTGVNLAQVSDGGEPFGTQGDQQDDPRFGDIRIGAIPLPQGLLAETFVPPPGNGGTAAGDIFFNSTINWQIGSSYDLLTVAAHEFGHALGLGESTVSSAVMYGTYNGVKESLASDDVSGILSIYATRTPDQFNSNGQTDSSYKTAANISSYIGANGQLALSGLENMSSAGNEWYAISAPASTTSTMTVTLQSSNLSSFAPQLQVYSSSMSLLGHVSDVEVFGATISVTINNVTPGTSYYIRACAAGGPAAIGTYGLLVNFSGQTQAPIAPPNTMVPQQPSGGGGTSNDNAPTGGFLGTSWLHAGSFSGWGFGYDNVSSTTNVAAAAANQSSQAEDSLFTLLGIVPVNTLTSGNTSSSSSTSTGMATNATSLTPVTVSLIVQLVDDVLGDLFS